MRDLLRWLVNASMLKGITGSQRTNSKSGLDHFSFACIIFPKSTLGLFYSFILYLIDHFQILMSSQHSIIEAQEIFDWQNETQNWDKGSLHVNMNWSRCFANLLLPRVSRSTNQVAFLKFLHDQRRPYSENAWWSAPCFGQSNDRKL